MIKKGIIPVGGSPTLGNPPPCARGLKVLINIVLATPAAINKETPEPKPHFEITSSINITIIPPNVSCKIIIDANSGMLGGTALATT